jgi:hypothetical protein
MDEMATSDDEAAPTLRSAEVWSASEGLSGPVPSPRRCSRKTPEIAVAEPARPASPFRGAPDADGSLLSLAAREVAAVLLDAARAAARRRSFWS